jgi:hypothetical protein
MHCASQTLDRFQIDGTHTYRSLQARQRLEGRASSWNFPRATSATNDRTPAAPFERYRGVELQRRKTVSCHLKRVVSATKTKRRLDCRYSFQRTRKVRQKFDHHRE